MFSFIARASAISMFILFVVGGNPAFAQDASESLIEQADTQPSHLRLDTTSASVDSELAVVRPAPALQVSRPRPLVPLYVSFAALQALDVQSTLKALNSGGVEGNPVMSSVVSNRAAIIAVKAASASAVILLTERVWHRNRATAIVLMVAINSGYAAILQHNYRVAAGR